LEPLSSLAHSGAEIARRGDYSTLPRVFSAIAERAEHLHHFVSGYATFAKLPAPRPERVEWAAFVADLARQQPFATPAALPLVPGWFDRVQVEQALINLLKNVHEAGGEGTEVELVIMQVGSDQRIEVRDRGAGMSQTVLAKAGPRASLWSCPLRRRSERRARRFSRSRWVNPGAQRDETFCRFARRSSVPGKAAARHRAQRTPHHWSHRWGGRRRR
jgi:hypothetical protein